MRTFGIKPYNCRNLSIPCDLIILDGTTFTKNNAAFFGSSVVGTKPDNVLIGCEARHAWSNGFMDIDAIHTRLNQSTLRAIDPKEVCKSWKDGRRLNDASTVVIGTFAHKFTLTTNSALGIQIEGNDSFGFKLKNVESGKTLPNITITTLDAFGNTRAPTILEGKALTLNSSEGFFRPIVRCSFKKGTCTIATLIDFLFRGNYTIHMYPRHDDLLEGTNLTIVVRECLINEESTWNMRLCAKCTTVSYNFNLSSSAKCRPCPENANCTTSYIKPKDGYWHRGPCHARTKRCIIEEACQVQDRLEKLDNLTRVLNGCNTTNATLANYSKAQCREVSMSTFAIHFLITC